MLSFARWNFYIHAKPDGQNVSRFDTLTQVYKSTGRKPKALVSPELDDLAIDTWNIFLSLDIVSLTEIDAYSRLTGEIVEPWQVQAIINIGRLRNKDYSKGKL